jgi:mannosyltransferase
MSTVVHAPAAVRRHATARLAGAARGPVTVPVLAGLAAVVITAIGSWIPSLWGDEAASALSAQRSLPSFLYEITHVDAVHAVYYAGLHVWVALFGASAFSLRFPSVLAGGAMVAGVVVLTRMFARSWRLPLLAGAIAMLLPRLDHADVEARSYAFTAAFAVWIVVVFLAIARGRIELRRGFVVFALLVGAGTAVNLFVGSMVAVTGCLAALHSPATATAASLEAKGGRRSHAVGRAALARGWAGASAVGLAAAFPVVLLGGLERGQVAFLAHRAMPPKAWLVSQWFFHPLIAIVGWSLIVIALVVMAVRRSATDRQLGVAVVLWAAIPMAFLIGTIPTLHNYSPRYLTFTGPAAAVLMALGVEAVYRHWRPAGVAMLVVVLGALVPAWVVERGPYAENSSDWSQVGQVIAANAHPGDQVAFDEVVRPSRRPISAYRGYPRDFRGLTAPQIEAPYWQRPTWHDELMTISAAAGAGRFTAGTVFAVEADYADEGLLDTEGVPSLEASGYHVVHRWQLHSDIVYELERPEAVANGS